ncbi:MAG: type transport system ATP-binding protein [Solirubrobacteraceae bacterium]|jgi:predicted acyl esterase|nr:type transport system ATP-binding protein [Solirubrobacteraceae bacterium]
MNRAGGWTLHVKTQLAAFALVAALSLAGAASAVAAPPAPFGHPCTPQNGVLFCPTTTLAQRVPSFDGVPLDVDVTLPATGNGPFPTIVMLHGWGNDKTSFESSAPEGDGNVTYHYNNVYYAQHGYAVVNYSARGWGNSCGSTSSRTPDCAKGWIHLADQRYEARDTQVLLGDLVDQHISDSGALGVTGISYGGGQSIELAYLKNRIRLPDGSFAPWTSPNGKKLSIRAAYPRWPWSDLVDALLPNGRFLDTQVAPPDQSRNPFGVEIQSYVSGLYALGQSNGFVAPAGVDPQADLTTWDGVINAGEPYGAQAQAIADQIYTYHQGYGLSGTPAPMLSESGWTDDLFPPEQSLRIYNQARAVGGYVALQVGDLGHSRGSNKVNTNQAFNDQGAAFFDGKLRGTATAPASGTVTAYTQTCPAAAPAGGPYTAASWAALHPGTQTFGSAAAQTVDSGGGSPAVASAFDPIAGTTDACKTVAAETDPGTAVYTMTSPGFTLMGLPTITATINTTGSFGELTARLWDVTGGNQRLITRGVYRLTDNQTGQVTFQLHGNGYEFPAGDTVKLELLGRDAPYYRASNGTFTVTISNLTVTLPTT